MRKYVIAAFIWAALLGHANAECTGSFLNDANRIRADVASESGRSPIILAADSHGWRAKSGFPDGLSMNGRKVIFAGIQGATFDTILECFPWKEVAATRPFAVIFMLGYNDAALAANNPNSDSCCEVSEDKTGKKIGILRESYRHRMDHVIAKMKALSRVRVFASDPAQGKNASYNLALFNYTMAQAMRTYATNDNFVDLYQAMPGTVCNVPYPYCYTEGLADDIHFKTEDYTVMINMLLANVGSGS